MPVPHCWHLGLKSAWLCPAVLTAAFYRTIIMFSAERLWLIVRPFASLRSGIPVVWQTTIVEGVLFCLAALFSLSHLVTMYYYLHVDDGISSMQTLLTPDLLKWYRVQEDAEVQICRTKGRRNEATHQGSFLGFTARSIG